jgi:flagellar biogenesis protein FliO
VVEGRTAFFHHQHTQLACGLVHLLALIAAWLVVTFHAERAERFQARQGVAGILQ